METIVIYHGTALPEPRHGVGLVQLLTNTRICGLPHIELQMLPFPWQPKTSKSVFVQVLAAHVFLVNLEAHTLALLL